MASLPVDAIFDQLKKKQASESKGKLHFLQQIDHGQASQQN